MNRMIEDARSVLDAQPFSQLVQAELTRYTCEGVELRLPVAQKIQQQHGFVHGGIVGMIADSAAGYAAMSILPADASVLTVEYKLNLVAPADGEQLIARGKVVRPGRTLIVTQAEVYALKAGQEKLCALMQQTIMVIYGKAEK